MSELANTLASIATVAGAIAAFMAINTWKKQKKSDIAEALIIHTDQLAGHIDWIRNPISYTGEGGGRGGDPLETEDQKKRRDTYFVPMERLRSNEKLLSEMHVMRMKAEIHFNEEKIDEYLKELHEIIMSIKTASHMLILTCMPVRSPAPGIAEWEKTIWYAGPDDPIDKRVEEISEIIPQKLKQYI
jgi:hypothetical protein